MRARLAGPALLLLVVAAFFRHLASPENVLYLRDLTLEVLPLRRQVAGMVAGRTFPWWTSELFGGVPTVAMVHGLFYPPAAVFFALPVAWALKVFIVGHVLLAGLGLFALLRSLDVPRAAALFGATGYMLSGYVLSLTNLVNLLVGAAWLPWIVMCFVRAVDGSRPPRGRWVVLTGVALGFQALADVEGTYMTVGILALYLLLAGRDRWVTRLGRGVAVLVVGGGIGVLLAAVELLPLAEFYQRSVRAAGLATEEALVWAYDPPRLLELVAPGIWGDVVAGPYWGWMFHKSAAAPSPLLLGAYLGLPPLILAAAAVILQGRSHWVRFTATLGVLGLVLAMGESTPVYPLFHEYVPLFDRFRYPVKWLLPASFAMTVLAGLGLGAIAARGDAGRRATRAVLAAGSLILLALVAGLFVLRSHPEAVTTDLARRLAIPPSQLALLSARVHVEMIVQGFMTAGWLAVTLFGLWTLGLSRLHAGLAQGALILLLLADLFVHNRGLVPVAPRGLMESEPPLASYLRQVPGPFRVLYVDTPERQQRVLERAASPFAPTIAAWYRSLLMPNTGIDFGLSDLGGGNPLRLADQDTVRRLAAGPVLRPRLLGAWNVKFLIVPYADLSHPALERVSVPGGDPEVRLYLNRLALSRAWWVPRARWLGDRHRLLEVLAEFDPGREVLLEGPDREESGTAEPSGRAEILSYGTHDIKVGVQASVPGFVVLAETYYPGWRATVDGVGVRLLRGNYSMRAVAVPEGTHELRFRYEPRVLYAGGGLSFMTALVVAGLMFRGRRRPGPPAE
jgi:hypothetical protein